MNKWYFFAICCLISVVSLIFTGQQSSYGGGLRKLDATSGGYKLVWSDEFNKYGRPELKNWTYERGFVRNRELQWYQPENARCENGLLVIEGQRERKANPRYRPDSRNERERREYAEYTSASLTTRGLHK